MPTFVIGSNTGNDIGGVEDTYIVSAEPDTGHDNATFNLREDEAPGQRRRGLIRFTGLTNAALDGQTVDSAFIRFYFSGALFGEIWSAYQVLRDWVEATADWNTYDGTNAWGVAGAEDTTTDRILPAEGTGTTPLGTPLQMDIALNSAGIARIQAVIDSGGSNPGWLVVSDSVGSQAAGSDEAADGLRPELHLETTAGAGGQTVNLDANGVASAAAFGETVVVREVDSEGVPSAAVFGSMIVSLEGAADQSIVLTGIASAATFGAVVVGNAAAQLLQMDGLATARRTGFPTLVGGIPGDTGGDVSRARRRSGAMRQPYLR